MSSYRVGEVQAAPDGVRLVEVHGALVPYSYFVYAREVEPLVKEKACDGMLDL